jgi:hypothetical protein
VCKRQFFQVFFLVLTALAVFQGIFLPGDCLFDPGRGLQDCLKTKLHPGKALESTIALKIAPLYNISFEFDYGYNRLKAFVDGPIFFSASPSGQPSKRSFP